MRKKNQSEEKVVSDFLNGKSPHTLELFHHFIEQFNQIGKINLHATKTMIAISTSRKGIAYITQLGKDFVHIVLPFEKPYPDNLCFQKIAQVPGDAKQFNHHFRMYSKEDVNKEVLKFMALAYKIGS